jgi:uncharacterized protein YggU (UPF0235/DUF167 family)
MFNQQQLKQVDQTPDSDPEMEMRPAAVPVNDPAATKAMMENTDIYYMPENFQKNNQVAGHNKNVSGIVVLILGILFLIILGGGLYIYLVKPELLGNFGKSNQPAAPTNQPVTTNVTPTNSLATTPTRPSGAPKDTYLAFRSELELADTVDKYIAVFTRYGIKAKQQQLATQKTNLESVGGQGDILTALRGALVPRLDGTEDIREDITDTSATLTVSKTSGRQNGKIVLLAEDGQWKISEETWSEGSGTNNGENGAPSAAQDDDEDGLSNNEEALLGTNAKASDSDTDGFKDAEELNNGYNPAGPGKITANESLATYLNTTFNFSLLYPKNWNKTIASTDDSVMFTADNHQFVQILVQPNSNQDDIVDWYKKTFNVQSVPNNQLVISEGWDGVKAPESLTVYLTNKDKAYIYVVTYNLGTSKMLEYKNIFDEMVRTLKLGV